MEDGSETSLDLRLQFYHGGPGEWKRLIEKFEHDFRVHKNSKLPTVIIFTSTNPKSFEKKLRAEWISKYQASIEEDLQSSSLVYKEGFVDYEKLFRSIVEVVSVKDLDENEEYFVVSNALGKHHEGASDYNVHFNITNAKPHEAFMMCKLSAIFPLITISEHKEKIVCMSPFPSFSGIEDSHFEILKVFKRESIHQTNDGPHSSSRGYLTLKDLTGTDTLKGIDCEEVVASLYKRRYLERSPSNVKSGKKGHPQYQYKITDDGDFLMRYYARSMNKPLDADFSL